MRHALGPFVASLAIASCVAACGSDGARTPESVGRTASPIIHGELDIGTTHDDVVYIRFFTGGLVGACTGTLIAPNVVTTARHCVSWIDESVFPPPIGADYPVKNMSVYLHTDPTGSGSAHAPDAKVLEIVHDGSTTLINHDFAMLVLDRVLSTDYSPIRLASPPTVGESVFVVGYGVTETDTVPVPFPHQRYWRDDLSILDIGPTPDGLVGSSEIRLGESICSGDSGGPVKDHTTGALLAVTSRGRNSAPPSSTYPAQRCVGSDTQNLFTRVDQFAELIKSTLAVYGETPWEEGTPKPHVRAPPPPPPGDLGSPCINGSNCKSGICVDADGSLSCSQSCGESAPCPSGFDCASGYCVRAASPPPPPEDAGAPPLDDVGTPPPGVDSSPDTTHATNDASDGCAMGRSTRSSAPAVAWAMILAGLAARHGRLRITAGGLRRR